MYRIVPYTSNDIPKIFGRIGQREETNQKNEWNLASIGKSRPPSGRGSKSAQNS